LGLKTVVQLPYSLLKVLPLKRLPLLLLLLLLLPQQLSSQGCCCCSFAARAAFQLRLAWTEGDRAAAIQPTQAVAKQTPATAAAATASRPGLLLLQQLSGQGCLLASADYLGRSNRAAAIQPTPAVAKRRPATAAAAAT
jgi:hypothetical protein